MATRTTRVGGFKFVTRKATDEEVSSWVETATAQGWQIPADLSGAVFSHFDGEGEELPFDLRTTWMTITDRMAIIAAADHLQTWENAENFHYSVCENGSDCERCRKFDAHIDRRFSTLRANSHALADRVYHIQSDHSRRVWAEIRECPICQNGTLNCDPHTLALAMMR